jgi:two-component system alkaline phosphatase synthesis response regulator PhoP
MAKKILIVDDEPNLVKLLESRLKANGYDVISASDGQQGLDKVRQDKPKPFKPEALLGIIKALLWE